MQRPQTLGFDPVAREREQRVAEGNETYVDWEEAKRQLRERHP